MASQIKVNHAAWEALPEDQQAAIKDIVSQTFGEVSIVPDANAPAPQAAAAKFALPGGLCKILCQVAGAAGHIACSKLPGPGKALCNAGVDAAEKLCEGKCH